MPDTSEAIVTLEERESTVLVQETPPDPTLVDASAVVDPARRTNVEVRFGGRQPESDPVATDVLVTPADADAVDADYDAVHTVGGPADVTGYGVALDKLFDDADTPLLVRLNSLTVLLKHVELTDAFRFVHVLGGRVARENAVLLAGIDAAAHGTETVTTLLHPFDVTVTDVDDDPTVRRRD
jgi:hypothetical protein